MRKKMFKVLAVVLSVTAITAQTTSTSNVFARSLSGTEVSANALVETESNDILDVTAPTFSEDVYTLLDTSVSVKEIETNNDVHTLEFTVKNNGFGVVENWSIAYEADYDIVDSDDVSIVDNSEVKTIKPVDNENIEAQAEVTFTIDVDSAKTPATDLEYRVYGTISEESLSKEYLDNMLQSADFTTYDIATGEESLLTFNPEDIVYDQEANITRGASAKGQRSTIPSIVNDSADMDAVLGGSDSRTQVTSVTSNPYYRIGCLHIKYSGSNSTYCGTGFMVSKDYMLTAAHVVYDTEHGYGKASTIKAFFGANGSTNKISTYVTNYAYCTSWPTASSTKNDWAWCKLATSVGSTTGYFGIGYNSNDSTLASQKFTVCGYPQDKYTSNSKSSNGGYNVYMYKDTSSVSVATNEIRYSLDTYGGQSGSPVYNSANIVYGIHHGGYNSSYNTSCRITQSIFNCLINDGVCSK